LLSACDNFLIILCTLCCRFVVAVALSPAIETSTMASAPDAREQLQRTKVRLTFFDLLIKL
jgi:hypothetical protein